MRSTKPSPPADDVLAAMAESHELSILSLKPESAFINLLSLMGSRVHGLTNKAFLPSILCATDLLLGPQQFEYVTQVDSSGDAVNTAVNISSVQFCNVAPTGSAKTFTLETGPRALGCATNACRTSAYPAIRDAVSHIPICKDGTTPTLLADGSAAFKFKVLEANPKVCVIGEFIDEPDGHLNRLESNGILDVMTELAQFNTGGRLGKNDGVTSGNREHFKMSRAMNLQPSQCLRFIHLDLGPSGADDGSGRNLGVCARNVLCLNNKVGAHVDAITATISEFDYQAMLNTAFASSDGAEYRQCPVQDISNKIVLGAKLASLFFPAVIERKYCDEIAAHKRRAASLAAASNASSNEGGPSMSAGSTLSELAASAGLFAAPIEDDANHVDPEIVIKRFKTIDGTRTEIEPPLSIEEQKKTWKGWTRRMVPSPESGPLIASKWNEWDRQGDALRATNPVEAGIVKKCKEHLGKTLPVVFFIEFASILIRLPTGQGHVNLMNTPVGTDAWTVEFITRLRSLDESDLELFGIDYLFDPFSGRIFPRANLISSQITIKLIEQSLEVFRLFLGHSVTVEPAWLALLHCKMPFVTARDVKDVRVGAGKCTTALFEATGKALEDAGLGYFVNVKRAALVSGAKMGEGPYTTPSGTGTPMFVKLIKYDDPHSGALTRAGSSLEKMEAAALAASTVPVHTADTCGTATKALMGLAGMTNTFHILKGESTFATLLVNANDKRIGTTSGMSKLDSLHKHLVQLIHILRISQGVAGLQLDPAIAIPSPPRPLGNRDGNAT